MESPSQHKSVSSDPSSFVPPAGSDPAEGHRQSGLALWKQGQHDEALRHFFQATQLAPDSLPAQSNLAEALAAADRFDEALAVFRTVLQCWPDHLPAHIRLGHLLERHAWIEEAAACYRNALRVDPYAAEAHRNLGRALVRLLRPEEGLASFDMALRCEPDSAEARLGRAVALLTMGRFEPGWDEYESRFTARMGTVRPIRLPQWNPDRSSGQTVLTLPEQGLGTEVLFASCLPDLIANVQHCVIECDPRLVNLFGRSFPAASVHPKNQAADALTPPWERQADCHIPLGSLPRVYRRSFEAFPARRAYLVADRSLAARWSDRVNGLGPGLKIGISWRGGRGVENVTVRSAPLDQWLPLFAVPNTRWVNLQYGPSKTLLSEMRRLHGVKIHDWSDLDPFSDLDDLAALISNLDLVVSVSNSTVHLAGALGVPAWVMLTGAADWRWLLNRDDSPWHRSVRLFRQMVPGQWADVFARMRGELVTQHASAPRRAA